MGWNSETFVLSADAQFNGSKKTQINSLDEYIDELGHSCQLYQVLSSPGLPHLLGTLNIRSTNSSHESSSNPDEIRAVRWNDERVIGYPIEFYQSTAQKPQYDVDFKGRHSDVMGLVRNNIGRINQMFNHALFWARKGVDLDTMIDEGTEKLFSSCDHELKGILKGYFKQKPVRSFLLFDIEPVDERGRMPGMVDRFNWLEGPYRVLKDYLLGMGIDLITVCSGKGYHFITAIPQFSENGQLSRAMVELMDIGGNIKAETMDKLVTTRFGSRKSVPTPLLSQRAYQGANKLMHYVGVKLIDEMRHACELLGYPPYIGFTDDSDFQDSLDMTALVRQVDMSCFGSAACVYNKRTDTFIVRIPRFRNGHEFFDYNNEFMLLTRSDPKRAKAHLINAGCMIPNSEEGISRLIRKYEQSRLKAELHDPLSMELNPTAIRDIIHSNYGFYRRKCPEIIGDIERAQPNFLDPKALQYVYGRMLHRGLGIADLLYLTYAVYCDPVKHVDIEDKKSKVEMATAWPAILLGENFKD